MNIEQSTQTSRIFLYFVLGALVAAIAIVCLVVYWSTATYDPLVFRDQNNKPTNKILIKNKNVVNGEYVILLPNFCKTIDAVGEMTVEVVGGATRPKLNWTEEKSKKGCHNDPVPLLLPVFTSLEPRQICFNIKYHPNPIREVEENICTERLTLRSL